MAHRAMAPRVWGAAPPGSAMGPAAEETQNVLSVPLSGPDAHRRGRLASCHVEPCGAVQAGPQGWGGRGEGTRGMFAFLDREQHFPGNGTRWKRPHLPKPQACYLPEKGLVRNAIGRQAASALPRVGKRRRRGAQAGPSGHGGMGGPRHPGIMTPQSRAWLPKAPLRPRGMTEAEGLSPSSILSWRNLCAFCSPRPSIAWLRVAAFFHRTPLRRGVALTPFGAAFRVPLRRLAEMDGVSGPLCPSLER